MRGWTPAVKPPMVGIDILVLFYWQLLVPTVTRSSPAALITLSRHACPRLLLDQIKLIQGDLASNISPPRKYQSVECEHPDGHPALIPVQHHELSDQAD